SAGRWRVTEPAQIQRRVLTVGQPKPRRQLGALELAAKIGGMLRQRHELLVQDRARELLRAAALPTPAAAATLGPMLHDDPLPLDPNPEQAAWIAAPEQRPWCASLQNPGYRLAVARVQPQASDEER